MKSRYSMKATNHSQDARPTHNVESRGRWRHSDTTADDPTAARRSNKKRVKTRALVHARMEDQR